MTDKEKLKHCDGLESILEALVDKYVANKGTKSEFISCITPEKRTDHTWLLWTTAMRFLAKKEL